jgi:hypothetical protein
MPSLLTNKRLVQVHEPQGPKVQPLLKQIENDRLSLGFPEDPIAYFSKRKDGRGHRFIYLNHASDPRDPAYDPYQLHKVAFADIQPPYFTMSADSVTSVNPDGDTENLPLDRWEREASIFQSLRKLRTFKMFFMWKPFRIWRNFVMKQHYDEMTQRVMHYSFYNNFIFFSTTIQMHSESPDPILKNHLLCFTPQRKYRMDTFNEMIQKNTEMLNEEYNDYLGRVVGNLVQLNTDIRDPHRLVVNDSDFLEIKRQNPNLSQLKILEQKKHAESLRRTDIVEREMHAFCQYVRFVDLTILEALASSCYECWRIAERDVGSDLASIFEIELSFSSDGKVVFSPTLADLLENVTRAFDESIQTLNSFL